MEKKIIIAAGGLVTNEQNELLMIFRRLKWDLPKGKLDEGESIEECAIREVYEETSITRVILGKFIDKTYHEYFDKWLKEDVIKESWWFDMAIKGNPVLIPQVEEDIEKIEWVAINNLDTYLKNSYDSIEDIIKKWLAVR